MVEPIKNVPLKKVVNVSQKEDEEELAEKVADRTVKQYVAGTVTAVIEEFLTIGREVRTKYEELAFKNGFTDVYEFLDTAIKFYLEYRDKILQLVEEKDKLQKERDLLLALLSKDIKDYIKAMLYNELMVNSVVFGTDLKIVQYWEEKINKLFEGKEYSLEEIKALVENFLSKGLIENGREDQSISTDNRTETAGNREDNKPGEGEDRKEGKAKKSRRKSK